MATGGHSEGMATQGPFRLFCYLLSLIACVEWFVYHEQRAWHLTSAVLVPSLLALAVGKFLAAVGWLMGRVEALSPRQKAVLFACTLNGSAVIVLLELRL